MAPLGRVVPVLYWHVKLASVAVIVSTPHLVVTRKDTISSSKAAFRGSGSLLGPARDCFASVITSRRSNTS